jgi:hypothetical protein
MWIVNAADMFRSMSHQGSPGQRSYTKEEMLAYARARGVPLSVWTFRDWIKIGLIGTAEERDWPGRGHGSGSVAGWLPQQFVLFQMLLAQKQAFRFESNAPYCNLPVWRWLYWGEQAGVELLQVKRALGTWQHWYQRNSLKERSVRKHVRELVARIASRHAMGTRELINELTTMALEGDLLDEATLRELFVLIIDPKGKGEARGPQGRKLTPEHLSRRISLQALAAELNLEDVPDPLWELARVGLLLVRERYQVAQREWEAEARPVHARCFPRASLRALTDSSCFLLLYVLAMLQRGIHPHVQANLQPRAWLAGEATATIQATPTPTALLLHNGLPLLHLRIDVSVSYRGNPWNFSFTLPYL